MSLLDDLIALLRANVEDAVALQAEVELTKASSEESRQAFEGIGAEGSIAESSDMSENVEQIKATVASLRPVFESLIAFAQSLKTGGGDGGVSVQVTEATTPGDAASVPKSHWRNEVGKPLEDIEDLEAPQDVRRGKANKLGRNIVRNSGNLKDQAEKSSSHSSSIKIEQDYNPLEGSSSHSMVETRPTVSTTSATPDAQVSDMVGTGFIVAAVVVEGASRLRERRRRRREGRDNLWSESNCFVNTIGRWLLVTERRLVN